MSAHDTQGMSPDEIALTNELDTDGLPPEHPTEIANREALQGAKEEGDGTDPAEAAAPAAAPAPAVAAPAAAPAAEATTTTESTEPPFEPTYKVDAPADADEKIKALTAQDDEAFAKYSDGDITAEAYREIKNRVAGEVDAIKTQVITASVLNTANEQHAANEWKKTEVAQFAAFKDEGIDYKGKPALLAAYNTNLKALAAKPENEAKDARWFLSEAHRLTKEDLGIVTTKKPGAAPAPAPAPRGVDRSALPPTLANVPPAADPATGGDEFAHMAGLTGADAEKAYMRMTPEQQERYLD